MAAIAATSKAALSGSQLKPPALPGDTYWAMNVLVLRIRRLDAARSREDEVLGEPDRNIMRVKGIRGEENRAIRWRTILIERPRSIHLFKRGREPAPCGSGRSRSLSAIVTQHPSELLNALDYAESRSVVVLRLDQSVVQSLMVSFHMVMSGELPCRLPKRPRSVQKPGRPMMGLGIVA